MTNNSEIEIRKNDWDLILRQTKEQLKAQQIQMTLTLAVIQEIERQKEKAPAALTEKVPESPRRSGA